MKLSKVKTRLDRNQKQWSAKLRQGETPRFMLRHGKDISKVWAKNGSGTVSKMTNKLKDFKSIGVSKNQQS